MVEGALLHGGGCGEHLEGLDAGDLRDDSVLSQRCQILEQRAKAVHGQALGRSLGLDLGQGARGALRLGEHGVATRLGAGFVFLIEEQRLEPLAHLPFDVEGEHAQEHVCAHPLGLVVIDRADVQVHALEAAKGALDRGAARLTPRCGN